MNLDELERRFIRAAQHELGPSAVDRERNQAALLERLAAESFVGSSAAGGGSGHSASPLAGHSASPLAGHSASPLAGHSVSPLAGHSVSPLAGGHSARPLAPGAFASIVGAMRGSRVGMLGVGLIVGAVVGGWFGFGIGRDLGQSERDGPPPAVADAVAAPSAAPAVPAADEVMLPEGEAPALDAPASEPELDPSAAAAEAPPLARDADGARPRGLAAGRGRGLRSAPAPQPESSLAVELSMLQRARRALNADNARLALGIVEELDERFPKGVLVEERGATRILSLCQLGRVAEAKQVARDFLGRYPSSVYAERVRESCVSGSSD